MKGLSTLLLAILFATGLATLTARAVECTWNGSASNIWSNAGNWTPHVPAAGDTATIPAGNYAVVIDSAVSVSGLNIGDYLHATGDASLTVAATGTLNLTGDMYLYGPLTNAGTLNWQNGGIYTFNNAYYGWVSSITNAAGGVFNINCDDQSLANSEGSAQFHNPGTLRKNAGTGTTYFNIFLDNTGTVAVDNGTLQLSEGGGKLGGSFTTAAGAALYLVSGNFELSNCPSFEGDGQVGVNGDLMLIGAFSGSLSIMSGSLVSGSSLTVASGGTLNILSTMTLYGDVTIASGGKLDITATMNLRGPLTNTGTVAWHDGDIHVDHDDINGYSGEIINTNNGLFDIQCDMIMTFGYDSPQFHNAGTLRKHASDGSTQINVIFDNTGTVEVQSGTLTLNAGITQHSGTTLAGGSWSLSNGAILDFTLGDDITVNQAMVTLNGNTCGFPRFTSTLTDNQGGLTLTNGRTLSTPGALANSGALRAEGATTSLTVAGAYSQTAGSTTLVDGAGLTATSIAMPGGTLAGTGTLHGPLVTTAATITPGLSAGTLTVTGNTTLGAANHLNMELGGITPGTQHDQLLANSNLTVGGGLGITFVGGFENSPAYGTPITLAVAGGAITGSFSNIQSGGRLTTANGLHSFAVYYGAGSPHGADKIVLADFSDNVAPVLSLPSNITKEAVGASGTVVDFTVSATDAVQGPVTPLVTPPSGSIFPQPGNPQFPLGTTTVQVSAQDAGGNLANGSFNVTVVDTTAPSWMTFPADIATEANVTGGALVNFSASAADIVDSIPQVVLAPASGSLFPVGITTVVATATDNSGNKRTGTFKVTVRDTIPPVLAPHANMIVAASGAFGALVNFTLSATDVAGATVTSTPASGSTFPLGVTTVNMTARDAGGNAVSDSFTVTVVGIRTWSVARAGPSRNASISGTVRGGPNGTVTLQASSDLGLSDPWEDIGETIGLDATGNATFGPVSDPNSSGFTGDFFRVRLP